MAVARPREFDDTLVRERIAKRFWAHGYSSTSIRDLEAASGVGVTSLYNAYGGKRDLFLMALRHYTETRTRETLRRMDRLASPAARIHAFVAHVTEAALEDEDRMGCLVINTAIELGPLDAEVAEFVADHLAEVEAFFLRNYEEALAKGQADPSLSAKDAARAFSAMLFGLRVLARTRPDRATMEGAVRPLLALLKAEADGPRKEDPTREMTDE
jgi:TetR/AcrR family transcriptional repressor of nem operon